MLRIDRFSRRLLCSLALSCAALLPQLGCTLITDVDRSKIPPPEVVLPDPEPTPDAGAADAGGADAGGADAGNPDLNVEEPVDAGTDAAAELDAGSLEVVDAQAPDGG